MLAPPPLRTTSSIFSASPDGLEEGDAALDAEGEVLRALLDELLDLLGIAAAEIAGDDLLRLFVVDLELLLDHFREVVAPDADVAREVGARVLDDVDVRDVASDVDEADDLLRSLPPPSMPRPLSKQFCTANESTSMMVGVNPASLIRSACVLIMSFFAATRSTSIWFAPMSSLRIWKSRQTSSMSNGTCCSASQKIASCASSEDILSMTTFLTMTARPGNGGDDVGARHARVHSTPGTGPTTRRRLFATGDFYAGLALRAEGKEEAALALYRRGRERGPEDPEILNAFAWWLAMSGWRLEEAREAAVEAARRAASNPMVLDTLGVILVALERYEEAVLCLDAAVVLDREQTENAAGDEQRERDPSLVFHLAAAASRSGRVEDAAKLLETAITRMDDTLAEAARASPDFAALREGGRLDALIERALSEVRR